MSSRSATSNTYVIVGALLLTSASCGILQTWSDEDSHPLAFNHRIHIEEAELECDECHDTDAEGADRFPTLEICADCHDVEDEDEAPEVVALLTGVAQRPEGARWFVNNSNEEIIFAHAKHEGIDCAKCHGEVAKSEMTTRSVVPSMDLCLDCHSDGEAAEKAPQKDDCAACHKEIRDDVAPKDHKLDWHTEHGRAAVYMDIDGMMEGRCERCHERDKCTECHRQEQPRSHTNFFRLRGHGLEASNDRTSCKACHQTDMCVRCHEDTIAVPPRRVGRPSNNHCVGCHEPVSSESTCAVCHKATPSHDALAPPRPSGHRFFTLDCRSCHGVTAALNHPDTGAECLACHR